MRNTAIIALGILVLVLVAGCSATAPVDKGNDASAGQNGENVAPQDIQEASPQFIPEDDYVEIGEMI